VRRAVEPLTRILVPLDFSEVSSPLVEVAARLSKKYSAEIVLFHAIEESVVEHVIAGYNVSLVVSDLVEEARRKLEKYKALAEGLGARVSIYSDIPVADPAAAIASVAHEIRASEVLLANKGWGIKRLLSLGSTSRLVVKLAETPVIIIKGIHEGDTVKLLIRGDLFGSILYAITRNYREEALDYVSELAAKTNSRLIIVHIREDDMKTDFLSDVERKLSYRGIEVEKIDVSGKPHSVILTYASASNVNSIFMERSVHEGIKSLFLGSTLDRVLNSSEIPVIVYPHRR